MGPITLFDKSFPQSLSPNEAIWFDNFSQPQLIAVPHDVFFGGRLERK